jgi:hypothetical protein
MSWKGPCLHSDNHCPFVLLRSASFVSLPHPGYCLLSSIGLFVTRFKFPGTYTSIAFSCPFPRGILCATSSFWERCLFKAVFRFFLAFSKQPQEGRFFSSISSLICNREVWSQCNHRVSRSRWYPFSEIRRMSARRDNKRLKSVRCDLNDINKNTKEGDFPLVLSYATSCTLDARQLYSECLIWLDLRIIDCQCD